ncbi:hypothetical protein IV203_015702 [Nitzschia inconspicua]|uniref:Uncharacterized protein n=1 Tax=Nitzschia inconspicua TaxID=303405 RepID=A0A9K3PTS0_9STRA|nr:hypothetical protein IV203_015702 [Nitzschia inconspicua]
MIFRAAVQSSLTSKTILSRSCHNVLSSTSTTATRADPLCRTVTMRYLATKPPGSNPLDVIRKECVNRHLCDEHGYRRPGVHWVFSLAVTPDDITQPPNLRTVGVQRISDDGIDFVMKKGSGTCDSLAAGRPLSILHLQGRYMPGETAEQWRGEGYCERMVFTKELLDKLPSYTITSMVASKRLEKEMGNQVQELNDGVSEVRIKVENRSHLLEVMQMTRLEYENGDVSFEEIDECIRPFRFHPTRLECMAGGPDTVLWNRWEWQIDENGLWKEPAALLSH